MVYHPRMLRDKASRSQPKKVGVEAFLRVDRDKASRLAWRRAMDTDALITRIAGELGTTDVTLRKWRQRGKVPHHMREQLREAAATAGFILRREHFDSFGKPAASEAA